MKTIHKTQLRVVDTQLITILQDSKLLFLGAQHGHITLWYECNPANRTDEIMIYVIGTGNPIPEDAKTYLGSVMMSIFVWHVYTR